MHVNLHLCFDWTRHFRLPVTYLVDGDALNQWNNLSTKWCISAHIYTQIPPELRLCSDFGGKTIFEAFFQHKKSNSFHTYVGMLCNSQFSCPDYLKGLNYIMVGPGLPPPRSVWWQQGQHGFIYVLGENPALLAWDTFRFEFWNVTNGRSIFALSLQLLFEYHLSFWAASNTNSNILLLPYLISQQLRIVLRIKAMGMDMLIKYLQLISSWSTLSRL